MNKRSRNPKELRIEEYSGGFKLYKVWTNKKTAPEPFLILDSIEELVENYDIYCKRWNIKPDMKRIYELISQQK